MSRRERRWAIVPAAGRSERFGRAQPKQYSPLRGRPVLSWALRALLAEPSIAKIVHDALLHFHGSRYELLAHVVMPNHVHVLFRLQEGHDLGKTIHSWKSFTAHKINKTLGREGPLWQEEYHDRIVRSEEHLHRLVDYIVENPKKACVKNALLYTAYLRPATTQEGSTGVPPVKDTRVATSPVPSPHPAPTRAGRPCPSPTLPHHHAD
jgi:REP element-mobilizing transposase RayT